MMRSHLTDTVTFSFNPFLPLAGRLLEVLLAAGPAGTAIESSNRTLAQLAQCSAGAIPAALRLLEAKNYIERVTTTRGSLIVVAERSAMPDQLPSAPTSDQPMLDRAQVAQATNLSTTPDRPAERSDQRSGMPDPPEPPTWNQHESHEQQQSHSCEALLGALLAAGAARRVAVQILERNPRLTIAEFETMCQIARSRRGVENGGIGLVFWCLLNNEPLYRPKELPHEERGYPNQQRSTGSQPRAGGHDRRTGARGGAARRAGGGGEKHDTYGVGAAYRDRPAESDLPPFLRQARERAR